MKWYFSVRIHVGKPPQESRYLLLLERFFQVELLPSPVFSDTLRFGAVLGFMETQLVSHQTHRWCCYLALSTVISFFNLRHLQDSKHICELFRVGGLKVKSEWSLVVFVSFSVCVCVSGRGWAFGLHKREAGDLEKKSKAKKRRLRKSGM